VHRHLRPSPALILALIALSVALSGTAVAAAKINGKNLKNRSVAAAKIKVNSLTGTEIREAKLGRVPLAAKADSATEATSAATATSAVNAEKLGGLAPAAFAQGGGHVYNATVDVPANTSNAAILSVPGIGTVQADCSVAGDSSILELKNESGGTLALIGSSTTTAGAVTLTPNDGALADAATGTLAGRIIGVSTFQAWNTAGNKSATFIVSNRACSVSAHAATNQ
jgi:hypothetical protein